MDGRKRRFLKMMTSNVVDRQKRFENATCGRGFFRKRRKKPPFSKISRYVWMGTEPGYFSLQIPLFVILQHTKHPNIIIRCVFTITLQFPYIFKTHQYLSIQREISSSSLYKFRISEKSCLVDLLVEASASFSSEFK